MARRRSLALDDELSVTDPILHEPKDIHSSNGHGLHNSSISEKATLEAEDMGDSLKESVTPRKVATDASKQQAGSKTKIPTVVIVPIWIGLSGAIILFNKHLFSTLGFPYPIFLTAFHMAVASIGTRILRTLPFDSVKPVKVDLPFNRLMQSIIPISVLFAASLILSNVAYVYLSVSFVQMLKAFIPILVLIIQLVFRLQEYNHLLLGIIVLTCTGCIVAAAGEIRFSIFGFICQVGAVIVESARLVMIQILLRDLKLDPISSIAMYAPICFVLIGLCIPFTEGMAPFHHLSEIGFSTLALNGTIAFSLNIAGALLIQSAGSLVLTLSGILKDILLIIFSVLLLGSSITGTQVFGYLVALCGLTLFRMTGGSPTSPLGAYIVDKATTLPGAQALRETSVPRIRPVLMLIMGLVVFLAVGHASSGYGMWGSKNYYTGEDIGV